MTTRAIVRNVHVSSRKANLVCALIRGKKATEALVILQHCAHKTARVLEKLLASAMANATNNHAMNGNELYVYSCVANQGRTIKRAMPRAKGSSNMIRKRHSHLEVVLSDNKHERQNQLNKVKAAKAKKVAPVANKPVAKKTTKPQTKPEVKKEGK